MTRPAHTFASPPLGYHVWRMSPADTYMGFGTGPATFMCQRCGKFTREDQPRGAEIDYPDPIGCEYVPSSEIFP